MRTSVLIPSRNERFLVETVNDVLRNARGDVEVVVALDGYDTPLPSDPRVRVVRHTHALGMRACINDAAAIATGDYLLKCDAHCAFGEGYDTILSADCADNWVVIPRRWSLDAEHWCIEHNGKGPRDYHYLDFPYADKAHDAGMHGIEWNERRRERIGKPEYEIDDTMSFQGSCWFMARTHWNRIGPMSEVGYGTFSQEPQEIGNKTWLGGGRVVVNKRTWYAHLHKGKRYGRMYSISQREIVAAHAWSAAHWMNDAERGMTHKFAWLVEKFSPLPNWPEHWQDVWASDPRSKERQPSLP